jgi:hypothetical protein
LEQNNGLGQSDVKNGTTENIANGGSINAGVRESRHKYYEFVS